MIRFLRQIRQRFIAGNHFSKYLLYATGEILLVVIGILIALQVDTWNNLRNQKQKEQLILNELHQEFLGNKRQLDTVVYYHKRSLKSAEYLMAQLPVDLKTTHLDSLAYHLYYMGWIYTYNPSMGITNSLLSNATYEIISNDELRQLLISWNDVLSDYQEEEIRAFNNYQNHLKPFEKEHFYFSSDYRKWLTDPRVDLNILETLAFDNYVQDRYNDANEIVNNVSGELQKITETINRIIALSDPENTF
ncbi:MAG: DUF6090 family protein [Robiginitalea sp.]